MPRPPRAAYQAQLKDAKKLASQLRAFVIADMGAPAFAAARAPYAEQLALVATKAPTVQWFGALVSAAPGATFRTYGRYWGCRRLQTSKPDVPVDVPIPFDTAVKAQSGQVLLAGQVARFL